MTQTVTAEYLDGIREGRAQWRVEGLTYAREHIDNLTRTIAVGQSKPVADMLRGERDFWRNQLRKAEL